MAKIAYLDQWVKTCLLSDMSTCCTNFFSKGGWHCQELQLVAPHENVLYVSSPFTLSDRRPLDFYVSERNGEATIYDDGLTIFALTAAGFNFENRRNWRSLALIVERYGFVLDDDGQIHSTRPINKRHELGRDAVALFSAVWSWERDRQTEGDMNFSLTNEVEELLIANDPQRKLTIGPVVQVGATEVRFDFLWGELYVDALRPSANAVNSRLRKGLLMRRVEADHRVLLIVDDTKLAEKAHEEMAVLASVSRSITLSAMRNLSRPFEVIL